MSLSETSSTPSDPVRNESKEQENTAQLKDKLLHAPPKDLATEVRASGPSLSEKNKELVACAEEKWPQSSLDHVNVVLFNCCLLVSIIRLCLMLEIFGCCLLLEFVHLLPSIC
jgi:hypothetical protein